MAKKKTAKKKSATKKKTTKKRATKKQGKVSRKVARARVDLHNAPKATRARVLRGITRVLAENGVAGEIAELHFELAGPPPVGGACPPGTVRRIVCFRNQSGTLVCEERCVPL